MENQNNAANAANNYSTVRASHILVDTKEDALKIKSDIESYKITFEDESSSSAYFWGCWPDTTNSAIPDGSRLVDEVGPHCTFYDNAVFEQLKTLREEAIQRAREICETRCCKNGVWVRFKFSPSDNTGVKILDWLKGNSSRNKPARLVGGGIWGGDVHVKCR